MDSPPNFLLDWVNMTSSEFYIFKYDLFSCPWCPLPESATTSLHISSGSTLHHAFYRGSGAHILRPDFMLPILQRIRTGRPSSRSDGVSWKSSKRLSPSIRGLGGMLGSMNHKRAEDQDVPAVHTTEKQINRSLTTLRLLLHTTVTMYFDTLFMWIHRITLSPRCSLKYAIRTLLTTVLYELRQIFSTIIWIMSKFLKWRVGIIYMEQ